MGSSDGGFSRCSGEGPGFRDWVELSPAFAAPSGSSRSWESSPAFAAGPELVVPAECMRSITELFVLQRDELRVVQRSRPVRLAATLKQPGPQPKA